MSTHCPLMPLHCPLTPSHCHSTPPHQHIFQLPIAPPPPPTNLLYTHIKALHSKSNNVSAIVGFFFFKAFPSLFNTSPLPLNALSSLDLFTLSMLNHLNSTELDYPVKITPKLCIIRAQFSSIHVTNYI